jgi:hypothetical protein
MEHENDLHFTPLFDSEDSSAYILYEVLKSTNIADVFISKEIGLQPETPCSVCWQHGTGETGSSILIETRLAGRDALVLIASETDDYNSTAKGSLISSYENARELYQGKYVYLIYVTQFTDTSIADDSGLLQPPTIEEFEQLKDHVGNPEHLSHITWQDFHAIMKICSVNLSSELVRIMSLHRNWIKTKNREDIKRRLVEIA